MTFPRFALARQLIAEERVGVPVREQGRAEDAAFKRSSAALQRMK